MEARFAAAVQKAASVDRFGVFVAASKQDVRLACALYLWDRDVAAAILRDIAVIEVALRNALSKELAAHLGPRWFLDPAISADPRLERARDQALQEFRRSDKRVTSSRVTSQLSLGFWVNLLDSRGDPLWRACLYRAFPGGKLKPRLSVRNSPAHGCSPDCASWALCGTDAPTTNPCFVVSHCQARLSGCPSPTD
jgi:hypothetical protein